MTVSKSRNSNQSLRGSRGTSRGLVDTSFAFVTDIIIVKKRLDIDNGITSKSGNSTSHPHNSHGKVGGVRITLVFHNSEDVRI